MTSKASSVPYTSLPSRPDSLSPKRHRSFLLSSTSKPHPPPLPPLHNSNPPSLGFRLPPLPFRPGDPTIPNQTQSHPSELFP
ncbi:hypothetical protein OIU76_009685 [Salix suchowensis]|nr:hypothetical protein OIU76_009685 [Salix suchowensis]